MGIWDYVYIGVTITLFTSVIILVVGVFYRFKNPVPFSKYNPPESFPYRLQRAIIDFAMDTRTPRSWPKYLQYARYACIPIAIILADMVVGMSAILLAILNAFDYLHFKIAMIMAHMRKYTAKKRETSTEDSDD